MLIGLLVGGCAVPITDGFSDRLPRPSTRTIVWGNHATLTDTATLWLRKHGIIVLEQIEVRRALAQHTTSDGLAAGEEQILRIATALRAEEVVFINRSGDLRAPMVTVRGIDPATLTLQWGGSARYGQYVKQPLTHLLSNLTCQALATAWRYRDGGQERLSSSSKWCHIRATPEGRA